MIKTNLPEPRGAGYQIAFVCLGNICRSPSADIVFQKMVAEAGLSEQIIVSSSGTGGWHVGGPMDPRSATALSAAGYDPSTHRAQQYDQSWTSKDLILAMDRENMKNINLIAPPDPERLRLFREWDPTATPVDIEVPDPYYGGVDSFNKVLAMVERTCKNLLADVTQRLG